METSFLQTQTWEKFQNSLGQKTFRVGDILVTKNNLPLGKNYLYSPRAKIPNNKIQNLKFFKKAKEIAQEENSIFLRIDPDTPLALNPKLYTLHPNPSLQPQQTLLLDLSSSTEEILSQMKPKTRYNIRVAQKHGVKVKRQKEKGKSDFETFWQLSQETSRRDKFRLHPKEYYQKMLGVAGGEDKLILYVAEYNKIPVSAILVWFEKEIAYYLHGASGSTYKNVMANYLVQWQAIQDAKARGCKYYDFWGISEQKWPGITRFKMGFAPQGKIVNYPDSQIIVYQPRWYSVYNVVKRIV